MRAKVKCERSVIQTLNEKRHEGGREWYRFLKDERMSDSETEGSLKMNGELIIET